MKAILKYALYQRPEPTNETEAAGYLPAGSAIEVKQVVSGKLLDGIGVWFYADDGFYYWSGGAGFSEGNAFGDWDKLSIDLQKTLLDSLVADQLFWFEKKTMGYIGCGWGYKNDKPGKGLAVSIFVDQKSATPVLGSTIRYKGFDIPLDVKPVDRFQHHKYIVHQRPPIAPDILNPVQMGGSISLNGQAGYGTRSLVVKNKDGIVCLMTCFHVLLEGFKAGGKFPVVPPQKVTAESPSQGRNLFRVKMNNLNVIEGRYTAHYDFAMVVLPANLAYRNALNNISFTTYYLIEELKSLVGQTVTMSGATSFLQSGKVLEVRASLPVHGNHVCQNIVVTEMISKKGDSGAPVVDGNGKLIGIVVSGNEKDRTLVLPVTFLFTQLGYQLL